MKRILTLIALAALVCGTANRSQAVELLVSGNFEAPGGATGEVPFWLLTETVSGTGALVDSAQITGPVEDTTLWLKPFAGGTGLGTAQGNFDGDGDVDGRDFLIWQRGGSPTAGSAEDLTAWQTNYGTAGGANKVNASLSQIVPGVAGDTYSFQGTSEFEEFYSGFVTTLGDASPFAGQASPTTTQFKMEFLNGSGAVIGSPTILDLRPEQTFPGFPVVHTPLVAVAPAGTANVRVVAEALDMVWNGATTQETPGNDQSAFFNDFSLTRSGAPGTPLLQNGDLNLGTPSALDFWNRVETACCNGEVQRTAGFANHTPGGTLGVWLSAFFGSHSGFQPNPVDGSISQTVTAVAGGTYTFSGWTHFEANFSGGVDTISPSSPGLIPGQASPTEILISLEFLDNTGVVIDSAVIDVREARQAACGGNANSQTCGGAGSGPGSKPVGWLQHTLQAVAPAGTVQARLRADMIDGVFNIDPGQSMFYDDFSLDGPAPALLANVSVPEPSSLVVLGLGTLLVGLGRNRK